MYSIFKTFFLSLCIIANVHLAYAETASILPPAKTTFLDSNGKPLTSGTIDFYIPSTTTRKATWQDAGETILNTNPVVLDAAGRGLILGNGSYRQVVKDRVGNIIWDAVTSSSGSGGGSSPTVLGDGQPVGTLSLWTGVTAPNQYVFAYGQEISRTTFPEAFTALTSTQAVFCSSGSPTITGLADTTNFWIGMQVELTCVVAGFSTIVSKTSSTITLADNSNITANVTARFFPWNHGNGTTTFQVPDYRGLVPAGNNNMGGVSGPWLSTTYFGSQDPNSMGASGGLERQTLVTQNLPPYTPSGTNAAISVTSTSTQVVQSAGAPDNFTSVAGSTTFNNLTRSSIVSTGAAPTFTGVAQGGTQQSFSLVQPTKTINYIVKIVPDTVSPTFGIVNIIVGTTTVSSGTSNGILYDNAGILGNTNSVNSGVLITNSSGTPILSQTLTLTPNSGFTLGENITQILSGAVPPVQAGSFLGYAANRILVTNNSTYNQSLFGLHVQLDSSGAGSSPGIAGGFFHTIKDSASGSATFANSTIHYVSAETNWAGGTALSPNGAPIALSVYARMGGTNVLHLYNLSGGEINVEATGAVGSTVFYKSGLQIANLQNDVLQGTDFDAALSISNISPSTTPGWRDGLLFSAANGQQPMNTANGTLIKTRGAATVLNGIDISSYTITTSAFKSANFNVSGTGIITTTPPTNNGLAMSDGTATAVLYPSSSFTNSVAIGASTNHPVIFLQNNSEAGYIDTSKQFNIGVNGITQGLINLRGLTSGAISIGAQAAAGTYNFNLPITAGTSGQVLTSAGGGSSAMTWSTSTTGTVTNIATTSPIGGGPITNTGTITCATCVTSAASLTSNQLIIGAGSQASAALGTLGTTTTVLHGNAAGAPTFGAVVSADLNITTTTCTNQFVTAISSGSVGTCTTDTLASAQHANQGTTTTVLHGNAAGNPSWAAVSLTTDVSGTLQAAQEPAHTGDVTNSAGSLALTLTTAQPAVHTWALTQTFSANAAIIGSFTPDAPITINNNTGASVAPVNGNGVHIVNANSSTGGIEIDAYTGVPVIRGRRSEGTLASKTVVVSGSQLLQFIGQGWDGSAYQNGPAIDILSAETWSGTARGSYIRFRTIPLTTTTLTEGVRMQPSGGLSIGATSIASDPGIGSLNLDANIFAPNLPTTTAALGAAVCWTTTTGQFQRDTNAGGCLVSNAASKHDFDILNGEAAYNAVMASTAYSFVYNDNELIGRQIGFKADDWVNLDKRLVGFGSNGEVQSFRYQQYTVELTAAFQHHVSIDDKRYKELEARITKLEGKK